MPVQRIREMVVEHREDAGHPVAKLPVGPDEPPERERGSQDQPREGMSG
jgi:hypothetical protein